MAVSESATPEATERDRGWMRRALTEARLAVSHGDVPVGALIVDGEGREVARAHNRREIDGDPTAHAEVLALRAAAAQRRHWRLEGCTLYATLEPCAMCAGALVNARIARLVYGASDPKAGGVQSLFSIGRDVRLNHRFEVSSDCLAADSVALLQRFFRELRARGEK